MICNLIFRLFFFVTVTKESLNLYMYTFDFYLNLNCWTESVGLIGKEKTKMKENDSLMNKYQNKTIGWFT